MPYDPLADTDEYPTYPAKPADEVNERQVRHGNHNRSGTRSRDEKLVEIGRAMQTPGRQTGPRG
jgi:hypothetical protein